MRAQATTTTRQAAESARLALALALACAGTACERSRETEPDLGAPRAAPAAAQGAPAPPERSSAAESRSAAAWPAYHDGDLVDEAAARGVDYVNHSGTREKATVLEANGAGVALLDLGRDGDLDLVFAQGLSSLEQAARGQGADLEVFENVGRGKFERRAGPGLSGWWTGLAAGDVDNDGDADLVAAGYGGLELLLQDGQGALARGPAFPLGQAERLAPGEPRAPGAPPLWLTSLALFDADRDGNLDLYACAYLELDPLTPPIGALGEGPLAVPCRWKGYPVFCGPSGMKAQKDRVFEGDGLGHFVDRSAQWLPQQTAAFGLGVAAFDADGDGDTDLYVANDSTPNFLWINDGRGTFQDVAYAAGVALSKDGMAEAGMGVAAADVDRDGRLDLCVTNFSGEPTQLYFGAKVGFKSMTHSLGLLRQTRELLSWGVHLADFDGDGWVELFTANGHVYPQADLPGTGTRYHQPPSLWRLRSGSCEFELTLAAPQAEGSILAGTLGTRSSALGDLDGDGRSDLVLTTIDGPAIVAMNRMGQAAARFALRLEGPVRGEELAGPSAGRSSADALGARVLLIPDWPATEGGGGAQANEADAIGLLREVQTSGSYQACSSPWLEFGLGPCRHVRRVKIQWPSGRQEEFGPFPVGTRVTIKEGTGVLAQEPLQ
jgi:hypothetical protein